MSFSTALSSEVDRQARAHLIRQDRQEDLCFAIWHPSEGRDRTSALLQRLVLPIVGERHVHGNASFEAQYFERALGEAMAEDGGLAFLHSHLGPGWQGMSGPDIEAEHGHAAAALSATGQPLVGLTLGTDGAWSARFWTKNGPSSYERSWCESVRVVGGQLGITRPPSTGGVTSTSEEFTRTVSAWGPVNQAKLAQLRVGVVGAGSVGVIVAEALKRMGIQSIRLFDFDTMDHVNLDRQLFATRMDADERRAKVQVVADALNATRIIPDFQIEPLEWSIVEEEGYRAALDCDVLFSCVDRPWPRSAMNLIAYAHLIPVIDGGIAARAKPDGSGLLSADWRAHIVEPGRRCLECLEQYDPGLVSTERDGLLDDARYVEGLPDDHPGKRSENVFAFSLAAASLEILQFLYLTVAPLGIADVGAQLYHFVPGILDVDRRDCEENCLFPGLIAMGEHAGISMVGRHLRAETERQQRAGITIGGRPSRRAVLLARIRRAIRRIGRS